MQFARAPFQLTCRLTKRPQAQDASQAAAAGVQRQLAAAQESIGALQEQVRLASTHFGARLSQNDACLFCRSPGPRCLRQPSPLNLQP